MKVTIKAISLTLSVAMTISGFMTLNIVGYAQGDDQTTTYTINLDNAPDGFNAVRLIYSTEKTFQ